MRVRLPSGASSRLSENQRGEAVKRMLVETGSERLHLRQKSGVIPGCIAQAALVR